MFINNEIFLAIFIKMKINDELKNIRKPEHEISSIFVNRWSPRAMTGEEISDEDAEL